jgi:hypothetical protein
MRKNEKRLHQIENISARFCEEIPKPSFVNIGKLVW